MKRLGRKSRRHATHDARLKTREKITLFIIILLLLQFGLMWIFRSIMWHLKFCCCKRFKRGSNEPIFKSYIIIKSSLLIVPHPYLTSTKINTIRHTVICLKSGIRTLLTQFPFHIISHRQINGWSHSLTNYTRIHMNDSRCFFFGMDNNNNSWQHKHRISVPNQYQTLLTLPHTRKYT